MSHEVSSRQNSPLLPDRRKFSLFRLLEFEFQIPLTRLFFNTAFLGIALPFF